jgi:ketosteroid isomerase-like protein
MGEADRIDLDEFRLDHEALAREDWDRAQRLHDPDIEWHDPSDFPDARVHRGRDAVRREVYESTAQFGGWSVEPYEFVPAGDRLFVASHWAVKGKERSEGLEFERNIFQVWTFRNGRAIKQQMFFDRAEAFEAAGLSE